MRAIPATERTPAELVLDTDRVMRAARLTVRRTLLAHKQHGDPVVVWEDGQAKWIPAADIVVPEALPLDP